MPTQPINAGRTAALTMAPGSTWIFCAREQAASGMGRAYSFPTLFVKCAFNALTDPLWMNIHSLIANIGPGIVLQLFVFATTRLFFAIVDVRDPKKPGEIHETIVLVIPRQNLNNGCPGAHKN